MISADFIICGTGLTGATIARQLSDAGREVLVLEKKNHVAGNCYDELHESGQRYNLHGPHYFRTNSMELFEYVQRFSEFRPFEAVLKSCVNGKLYDYPVTQDYINACYPDNLWSDDYLGRPDFEGECLTRIPRSIYNKFVKSYTEKMWGKPAREMDKSLASRVEVRQGDDRRLSTKKYQGVPKNGYTQWIANMLDGIPVRLEVDYLNCRSEYEARKCLIFTGSIDAYFNYDLGRLQHRSQSREHTYLEFMDWRLPTCQVNYPSPDIEILREIEWKHIWPCDCKGTLITSETPVDGGDEYPFPSYRNQELYQNYRDRSDSLDKVIICGRLGEEKYFDMDQAISRAQLISRRLLGLS